jgi:RNA polymerase sigma-70 factor (ECF subfamily)
MLSQADVAALWRAARAAWPGVELSEGAFAQRLAQLASPEQPPAEHAAEVYLALACANGDPAALAAFEAAFSGVIAQTVARVDASATFRDEVTQVLRQKLFVALDDEQPPKILQYAGRAPLRSWLRVAAKRTALNLRDTARHDAPAEAGDGTDAAMAGSAAPELAYMKALYKDRFEAATRDALRALVPRQRTLLRLHLGERMTLMQLGAAFDVSHATAKRWLEAARDTLVVAVRRALVGHDALSPSEFESVAALVRSQLDVQVVELLRSVEAKTSP